MLLENVSLLLSITVNVLPTDVDMSPSARMAQCCITLSNWPTSRPTALVSALMA